MSEFLALWVLPALATVGTLVASFLAAGTVGVWDPGASSMRRIGEVQGNLTNPEKDADENA